MSDLTLRLPGPADQAFLLQLFRASRPELVGLPESLIAVQLRGQTLSYSGMYPQADTRIVLVDGRPVGRLIVDRSAERIHLVDIALLPESRGSGIGTTLLKGLQAEAARAGLPLRLRVYPANPARRLYERLGFTITAEEGPQLLMTWQAGGVPCTNP